MVTYTIRVRVTPGSNPGSPTRARIPNRSREVVTVFTVLPLALGATVTLAQSDPTYKLSYAVHGGKQGRELPAASTTDVEK